MDELVKLVSQKAGIGENEARTAVQVVLDQLKQRLPAPIASQIDSILKNPSSASSLGDIGKGLGGMLGGQPKK